MQGHKQTEMAQHGPCPHRAESKRKDKTNQAHKYEERQKGKITVLAFNEMGVVVVVFVVVQQMNR